MDFFTPANTGEAPTDASLRVSCPGFQHETGFCALDASEYDMRLEGRQAESSMSTFGFLNGAAQHEGGSLTFFFLAPGRQVETGYCTLTESTTTFANGYKQRKLVVAPAVSGATTLTGFPVPLVLPAAMTLTNGAVVSSSADVALPTDVVDATHAYSLPTSWARAARTRWYVYHDKLAAAGASAAPTVWAGHAALVRLGTTGMDISGRRTCTVAGAPSAKTVAGWPGALFDGIDDGVSLTGIAAWSGATAMTVTALVQGPFTAALGPRYDEDWFRFDTAGAVNTLDQSSLGVRLLADPNGSLQIVSQQQMALGGGFTLAFDYRVDDTAAHPTNGTFITVGVARGDGASGFPANVANWASYPTETDLQAHGTGWRVSFDTRNGNTPSINDEVRIRHYPTYTQFANGLKIPFTRGIVYRIEVVLAGGVITFRATDTAGTVRSTSYTSATFALTGSHNLVLRVADGRDATLSNMTLALATGTTQSGGIWGMGANLTSGNYLGLWLTSSRKLQVRMQTSLGPFGVVTTQALDDDQPHAVATTWAGGQRPKIWVDGVLQATVDAADMSGLAGTTMVVGGDLWIGLGPGGAAAGRWQGRIGELAVAFSERPAAWIAAAADAYLVPIRAYGVGSDDTVAGVKSVVAVPTSAATAMATAVDITPDVENPSGVAYVLTAGTADGPLNGSIAVTGTPSRLRYTPSSGFSGLGRGSWAITAGAKSSSAAWVATVGGAAASWEIPTEGTLPANTRNRTATPGTIVSEIASATAGTHITLTGGPYGSINLSREIGKAGAGKAVLRAAPGTVIVNGTISVNASGWVVTGLDVRAGTCIAVNSIGPNGSFRATRNLLKPSAYGITTSYTVGWYEGGFDYNTFDCTSTAAWIYNGDCREERDLLIHHNDCQNYGTQGIYTGTESQGTGWRPARIIGFNRLRSGAKAFGLEVKGSRVLVINNDVGKVPGAASGELIQHRNGSYCCFVANKSSDNFVIYGLGDVVVDNQSSSSASVMMGNYDQADWLRTSQPPTLDDASRRTTYWDRYRLELSKPWAPAPVPGPGGSDGASPSPRPAARDLLLVENNFASLTIGSGSTDATLLRRPRPAANIRIEKHTGSITKVGATFTVDCQASGNDALDGLPVRGPRPAILNVTDNSGASTRIGMVPAGFGAPPSVVNAILRTGAALPPRHAHVTLTSSNVGWTATT